MTKQYKYTKTLVRQNPDVPFSKHLFCIIVHCFALLNIALLCITLLTLLCHNNNGKQQQQQRQQEQQQKQQQQQRQQQRQR